MKKLRFLMPLCLVLLLCACKPIVDTPPTTTQPATVSTQPVTEPTTQPTTAPTEPEIELNWLVTDRVSPSYEKFFSQNLPYNTFSGEWAVPHGDQIALFSLRSDVDGLYVTPDHWTAVHWVPNSETIWELPIAGADGKWGYLVSDEGILRLDILTGETSLFVEHSGILQAELCGYDVLYYAATNSSATVDIYRLYIPTMTQDILCEGIKACYDLSFSFPSSTLGSITWSSINPDMFTRLVAELNDPNSPYKNGDGQGQGPVHLWENPDSILDPDYEWGWDKSAYWVCRWIQEDTGIHTWYKCTYDPNTDIYSEDTGVIDNCWFGSGFAHDHFEPEITSLPDPIPAVGAWIPITDAALPSFITADSLYAEGPYDYSDAGIPYLIVHGQPLEDKYVYYEENLLTRRTDVSVTMAVNSTHFLYCVTKDNTLLQISHDGSTRNVLYTGESEIRNLAYANGRIYLLDGHKIIEVDVPALRYRVVLEQDHIVEFGIWDEPGQIYFAVARGLHYQQYLFTPESGVLEQTFFL